MQHKTLKTLILFLIPLLLYVVSLPFVPLMEPDEGRYSVISSAMNATGDYVTPRLKEAVYFEKPPLAYWATAIAFRIFGENEFSSRLFAALCAWGCIILTYRMGVFFHDTRTGLYAGAVLTTFLYHTIIGRINILDMPLAFFVCLAIWSGFRYLALKERRKIRLYLLYIFSALAFLTKGLIGIIFPFGVVILWLIISRRWRDTFALFSPIGALCFAAIAMPWLILIQKANPDFFHFFFIQEHLLRYVTRMHDHYEPFYYYFPIILVGTLPWCAFLPEALRGIRRKAGIIFSNVEKRFFLVWIFLILIFFSVSSSKLVPYITPIFLPIALIFGHLFRIYEDNRNAEGETAVPLRYRATVILQALLFTAILLAPLIPHGHQVDPGIWWPWMVFPILIQILILFLPDRVRTRTGKAWFLTLYILFVVFLGSVTFPAAQYLTPYKSAWPLSKAVKTHLPSGVTLYQYGISLYGIDFYTGMRTPIVDDIGEVKYGSERLPQEEKERYFLSSASFFRMLQGKKDIYCTTKGSNNLAKLKKEVPALTVLWHNDVYYLVKLN
ncbi:MAG: glycosyltransferase family 39 protein [Syntrophales bacterium]|nr:glycosyltransferase family 39 protein [Syntrophales bacterium]